MVNCFECKKELGRFSTKWESKKLESMFGIRIPSSTSEDDRLCGDCASHLLKSQQVKEPLENIETNVPNPTSNTTPTIQNMAYSPPTEAKEKIVIIRGSWNTQGSAWKVQEHLNREKDSGIHYTGDLQDRFIEFAKNHDIIDVTPVNQSVGHEIVLVVRYKS